MTQVLFFVLAILAVFSASMVITRRNPINSGVWLLATFVTVAALFILMNAPFIAMIQITVYAGAIMVLILFVIMLLNLRGKTSGFFDVTNTGQRISAIFLGAVLLAELLFVLVSDKAQVTTKLGTFSPSVIERVGNTQALGNVLFSKYVWPFEVVSILLVVAIIGAVIITRRHKDAVPEGQAGETEEVSHD